MKRREFLAAAAAAVSAAPSNPYGCFAKEQVDDLRTFATPSKAQESPPEKLAYVVATYAGTGIQKPDYLATIDVDPHVERPTRRSIHRLPDAARRR